MPYQDYCRKWLDPTVWQRGEQHLHAKVRGPLVAQLRERFPEASSFYIVGRLTGHYYDEESTLDVLVACPKPLVRVYTAEATVLTDHQLAASTPRTAVIVFVPSSVGVQTLASKFGPLYDMGKDIWVGRREVFGVSELASTEALLRSVNWELFKLRKTGSTLDVDPKLFVEGFRELDVPAKNTFIAETKERSKSLDLLIQSALTKYPAPTWKAVETLENSLMASGGVGSFLDQLATNQGAATTAHLPEGLKQLIFHRHRYEQLVNAFSEELEDAQEAAQREEKFKDLPIEASVKTLRGNTHMTTTSTQFGVVRVEGSLRAIDNLHTALLERHIRVASVAATGLCLARVNEVDLPKLTKFCARFGDLTLTPLEATTKEVLVATPAKHTTAAPRLNLLPQKWYFAENHEDTTPFVFIKTLEEGAAQVELLNAQNTLPVQAKVTFSDLTEAGLRPATQEDFTDRDLPPPESQFVFEKEANITLSAPAISQAKPVTPKASAKPVVANLKYWDLSGE